MMKKKIFNRATNKFENMNAEDDLRPPDAYEINEVLNKNRRPDDQIKEVPSSIQEYTDYEDAKSLAKTYLDVKKNPNKFSNRSAVEKWNAIHKAMTPKERREFYKNAEDAIIERLKSKPDPDLQRGLGSITYKLNKD